MSDLATGVVVVEHGPRGGEEEERFQEAQPEPGGDEAPSEVAAIDEKIEEKLLIK